MRFVAACLICVSVVLADNPKKYAVIVGVNKYEHPELPSLRFACNDATELSRVFANADYEVKTLTDFSELKPTKQNIEATINQTLDRCRGGDAIVICLAGHGLQFEGSQDSFFCPSNAQPFKEKTSSLVSLGQLYNSMRMSLATAKILLVDACRNDLVRHVVRAAELT